jgi:hypothetical protein
MSLGKASSISLVLVVLIGIGVSPAWAAFLPIGGTLFPAPGEADPVAGVVIANTGPVPFGGAAFTGTLTSQVVQGDANNPWGGLTFTYLLTNDPNSKDDLERVTVVNFTGFLTDASFQIPAMGMAPAFINRSTPDVVGFSFMGVPFGPGTLKPGMTSALLVVQTNAPRFQQSLASVIDGSAAKDIATFCPVPEPATLSLLVLGGLAVIRRVRR